MEELRNEEVNMETNEALEADMLDETESTEVANSEELDSSATTKFVAGGITVIALAGYGAYQLGKNVVVPGVKKGASWIKNHFGKKKEEAEVIDAEGEFVEDDFFDEEDSAEAK